MLQWMGGSRRKVSTSRKSTQKRQKQYFEQRKRRLDNLDGGQLQREHHRSLDILNFLSPSLAPLPQQQKPGVDHPMATYSNVETPSAYDPPIITAEDACMCSSELKIEDKDSFSTKRQVKGTDMPLLDLLGDEGTSEIPEGNPVNEDHVAFSIDGLGKLDVETPIHSPQHQSGTIFPGDRSPSKYTSSFNLFQGPSHEPYPFICDADTSISNVNAARILSPSAHKLDARKHKHLTRSGKHYGITDDDNEHIWNAFQVFSDDSIYDGKSHEVSWTDDPFRWDIPDQCARMHHQNRRPLDHTSDYVQSLNIGETAMSKDNFSISESLTHSYPTKIGWSFSVMEDRNDSLSSNSAESCSSMAGLRDPRNKLARAAWPETDMVESRDHEESFSLNSKKNLDFNVRPKELVTESEPLFLDSDYRSFHGSAKKKTACAVVHPWNIGPVDAFTEITSHEDHKLSFDQSKRYPVHIGRHLSSCFPSPFACDQTYREYSLHNFRCLPDDGFVQPLHTGINYFPPKSSDDADFSGEMSKEIVGGDVGSVPMIQPEQFQELHLKCPAFMTDDSLPSEMEQSGDENHLADIFSRVENETASCPVNSRSPSSSGASTRELEIIREKQYLGDSRTRRAM